MAVGHTWSGKLGKVGSVTEWGHNHGKRMSHKRCEQLMSWKEDSVTEGEGVAKCV